MWWWWFFWGVFQSIILCIAPRQALAEISRSRRFPACLQPWLGLCRANEAHSLWRSPSASTVRQPLGLFAIHDVEGHFIIWKKLTSWKGEKVSWVSSATGFVPSVSYFLCCLAKQKIWKIWFAELLAENHSVYLPKSPDVRKSHGSSSKFLNLASGSLISCQGFFLPMIGLGKNGTEKGRKVRYPEVHNLHWMKNLAFKRTLRIFGQIRTSSLIYDTSWGFKKVERLNILSCIQWLFEKEMTGFWLYSLGIKYGQLLDKDLQRLDQTPKTSLAACNPWAFRPVRKMVSFSSINFEAAHGLLLKKERRGKNWSQKIDPNFQPS